MVELDAIFPQERPAVTTKVMLAGLSVVFLVLGIARLLRDGGKLKPAAKTWLLIGSIFGVVSIWLFNYA